MRCFRSDGLSIWELWIGGKEGGERDVCSPLECSIWQTGRKVCDEFGGSDSGLDGFDSMVLKCAIVS